MIEFIRWRINLWLVGYQMRVRYREEDLTYRFMDYGWPFRWLRDLVDRISPWDPMNGYRRVLFRRIVWKIVHPLITMRLASLRWSLRLLDRITPYTGPGKYGEGPSALQAEWLDTHSEYATDSTGDMDYGLTADLFEDLDVPWSRKPETWLIETDSHGFVVVTSGESAKVAFSNIEGDYGHWLNADDEPFDDDEPVDTNREGDPAFNGAFG